jgi:hypothetical protein
LSITSCLVRNDYNVIFSFLILIILNNFYNQNPKLFAKIIIQISALLIAFDIIWLIVMMPTWSHSDADKSEYWKSLSGIHTFAIIFAFLELIMKGLIAAYLVYDFKQKYPEEMNELYKLTYLQNMNTQSNNNRNDF